MSGTAAATVCQLLWRCTVLGFVCITPVASLETLSYEVSPPPIHLHAWYKVSVRLTESAVMHTIECRFFGDTATMTLLCLCSTVQACRPTSTLLWEVPTIPPGSVVLRQLPLAEASLPALVTRGRHQIREAAGGCTLSTIKPCLLKIRPLHLGTGQRLVRIMQLCT